MQLAGRMSRLGTETAFEVLARARALEAQGKNVVHLEIGEPDFDTPAHVIDAGVDALRGGFTHYGPSPGIPQLREAVAEHVARTRGVDCKPGNVVVTPGGKPIMFFAMLALVDEGDEVLYPNPGFPIYESMIRFCGGKPVPVPLRESREFSVDVGEIASLVTDRTKLLILNSPQNPTGGVMPKEDVAALVDLLRRKPHVNVLSDEIYSDILYEGEHHSVLQHEGMAERTILLDGFSKTYAMTGWRLGYGVMPETLAAQRRDAIVDGLNAIPGFRCLRPKGAFYVFPNVEGTGIAAKELQSRLLEEAGVACLAGTAFGAHGEGYLRFSYANSLENIHEALSRIRGFIG